MIKSGFKWPEFKISYTKRIVYFYSDLVWRMQLMIIKGLKFVLCV